MQATARNTYLATEILTATPQRLQLLLIDGAMRFAEKARQHWRGGANEEACEAIIRAQEIVSQILIGLNREELPELIGQISAVYGFIYRRLVEANLLRDEAKLDEALRVLAEERETWRRVCDQAGSANRGKPTPELRGASAPVPPVSMGIDPATYTGGVSLDA